MKDELYSLLVGGTVLIAVLGAMIGFVALVFKWPWVLFLLLIPLFVGFAIFLGEMIRDDLFNR